MTKRRNEMIDYIKETWEGWLVLGIFLLVVAWTVVGIYLSLTS